MEERISRLVKNLRASVIREMSVRAATYDNVISLGIGEPDFDTPDDICRLALEDAVCGSTHYTPSQGDPELLKGLENYLKEWFGFDAPARDIVITGGGMGALTAFFRTVLDLGDEVIVPEPHFPAYRAHIEWAGGVVRYAATTIDNGFVITPQAVEAALTAKSKVLLLNSPNNPTGAVIPGPVLDDLADLVRAKDLLVVTDEVYDRLLYDGRRHESIMTRPGMAERTMVIGSFSKSFAMTGWRLGWAFGPTWLMKEMLKVVAYLTSCAPSVSQRAAVAALKHGQKAVDDMVEEFRRRRDFIYDAFCSLPGVRVTKPAGSFYMFPNIESLTDDTERFALELLDQERVVVVPGSAFGPSGAGCVRVAFTVDQAKLVEAMERIKHFVTR